MVDEDTELRILVENLLALLDEAETVIDQALVDDGFVHENISAWANDLREEQRRAKRLGFQV